MSTIAQQNLRAFQQNQYYALLLGLTLAFFLYKGIWYATLGSFVPLLLIGLILLLLFWSVRQSAKAVRRVLVLWSVLLLLWAGARLLLSLVDMFLKPLNEAHVHEQLSGWGLLWAFAGLIVGIYLWRKRKIVLP